MSETPIKKQALLIGINEYQFLPQLKYARQDAEAVAESLKQNYCFSDDEILLLTDAKRGMCNPVHRRLLEVHLEHLADQNLDLFIFGFWGHSLFRNGQRYFCPRDAISEDIKELGLSFDSLKRLLSNIRAKNTCMILDCCPEVLDRGEEETLTAADQTVMENAARDIVLRRKEIEPEFQSNVAILNSCIQGQSAYEWDCRKHGIFTAHLLDAMNRRYDSVAQIVSYISKNVEKTSMELGKTQTPFFKLDGDILLPVDTKSASLVTKDVFLSYLHRNIDLVAPVKEELKKRGISYFDDTAEINYGLDCGQLITKAIASCKLMLLFWTPDVKGTMNIVREVAFAKKHKKPFVIYKVGDFSCDEHLKLHDQIAEYSCYEVPQQTPETIGELADWIQQLVCHDSSKSPSPVISQPELACISEPRLVESVPKDIFISYQQCNVDLVAPVAEELDKRGFTFFMDRPEVINGEKDAEVLFKAISCSKLVLLFWTPEVNYSDKIIGEVSLAKYLNKKLVIYKVGNFDYLKDPRLNHCLCTFSRYEVLQQTPETVKELVNQIEQACLPPSCCAPRACPPPSCSFEPKISPSGANSVPFFSLFSSIFSFFKWFSKESVSQLEQSVGKNAVVSQPKPKTPASQQERIVDNNAVVSQLKPKTPVTGDVFISYRSHNLGLVKPILKELNKRGITYFIDREKLKSGNYSRKISVAINSCKALFLFWTEDVDDSKYIPNEVHLAFDWGKAIVPYKVGNFDIDKQFSVIFYLKNLHILEESQDSVSDVADSIQQALEELS